MVAMIPPPQGPQLAVPTVNPRKFALNRPSQRHGQKPKIPTPARSPVFTDTHTLTTHIFPAATPRISSPVDHVEVPRAFKDKAERRSWVKSTAEAMLTEKKAIVSGALQLPVHTECLWNTANRVARNAPCEAGRQSITLVATHPIGFHKETWEQAFRNLIELTETPSSTVRIEELWSIEAVHHGDTAIINVGNIPKFCDRADYGKDIVNLCMYYLPDDPRTSLPELLDIVDEAICRKRLDRGYSKRTLVGLGHSLGGDCLALGAIHFPSLFSACILLETTLFPVTANSQDRSLAAVASALGRRSSWASREEAREALLKAPLFQTFHPAVFDSYIVHGLRDDPQTGTVHLKQSTPWEATDFAEVQTNNETWELLPTLDERVKLLWILGGNPDASNLVGGEHITTRTVWQRPKNSSNVKIADAGHLVVQQKPFQVAEEITKFLEEKYGSTSSKGETRPRL